MTRYQAWVVLLLLGLHIATHGLAPTVVAQAPSVSVPVTLPKASPNDRVPVVITLKNVDGIEQPLDSNTIKS
ncbi:MAG: hypothetical protein FJ040_06605 [Chloroflexi bacterium]|nr:hypothetical protein [Chloroflexota bacterium]